MNKGVALMQNQVRLYLYLSTMSAARTQYLYDELNFKLDPLSLWQKIINSRHQLKKVLLPEQKVEEPEPSWIAWPKNLNQEVWRDFLARSSRLPVDVLILSFIMKKNDKEVSEILGITEGGVLISLSEGLARLGECLK
jgi:DNA-directed RNA polymerase specialized sigma24 family protein